MTKPSRSFWALIALAFSAVGADGQISTTAEVEALLDGPTGPGVYRIAPGTYTMPAGQITREGQLSGTADEPLVIRGAGIGQTIIECPVNCFISENEYLRFEDLTFRGQVNAGHFRHWVFQRVRMEDPNSIAHPNAILFKGTGLPRPAPPTTEPPIPEPRIKGAGPIEFLDCEFEQGPVPGGNTALAFVAVQGVTVLRSTFDNCHAGCIQAKGGSGILIPYEFGYNWLKNAGVRSIMMGGSTNWEFFDPPISEAGYEFGAADVHDNIIENGRSCFVASTTKGPIRFRNNLCYNPSIHVFRVLDENASKWTQGGVGGVSYEDNAVIGLTPATWPKTNWLQLGYKPDVDGIGPDRSTLFLRGVLSDGPVPIATLAHPQPVEALGAVEDIIHLGSHPDIEIQVERDASGRPWIVSANVDGWERFGPRRAPEPPPEPKPTMLSLYLVAGSPAQVYGSRAEAEAAAAGAEVIQIDVTPR